MVESFVTEREQAYDLYMCKHQIFLLLCGVSLLVAGCGSSSDERLPWQQNPANPQIKITLDWQKTLPAAVVVPAVWHRDTLVIGTVEGEILAYDENGQALWQTALGGEDQIVKLGGGLATSDHLIFAADDQGHVAALRVADGQTQWTYQTQGPIECDLAVVETSRGPVLLVGSDDNHLYALDARTGERIWAYETEYFVRSRPLLSRGYLFFGGCDEFLHKVNADNGQVAELLEVGEQIATPVIQLDDLVGFGTYKGGVFAVDPKTMEMAWHFGEEDREYLSAPAYSEGIVVVAGGDRTITGLDVQTGQTLWHQPVRNNVSSDIVTKHGLAFVGCEDERLYVVRIKDGKLVSQIEVGGSIKAAPVVTDDTIFVMTDRVRDGQLLAFKVDWPVRAQEKE